MNFKPFIYYNDGNKLAQILSSRRYFENSFNCENISRSEFEVAGSKNVEKNVLDEVCIIYYLHNY